MGSNFEKTAEQLIKADPVEKSLAKSKKATISSTLWGRGTDTWVEFQWYNVKEYNKLSDAQKKELGDWRKSAAGQAAIKASTEACKKRKKISGVHAGGKRPTKK